MTKLEYDELKEFPAEIVTMKPYYVNNEMIMRRGDTFTAIRKETLGKNDYSVIDSNGHPHYYEYCDVLPKVKD